MESSESEEELVTGRLRCGECCGLSDRSQGGTVVAGQ